MFQYVCMSYCKLYNGAQYVCLLPDFIKPLRSVLCNSLPKFRLILFMSTIHNIISSIKYLVLNSLYQDRFIQKI